jgi:hypothetical protein
VAAAALLPASAAAKALRAMVTRTGSTSQETWYVVSGDEKGLMLSAAESGSNAKLLAADKIESVAFSEPEGWAEAQAALNREQYAEAARRFGQLADEYEGLFGWEDSYGARAKFLQMESLRLGGDYEGLATQVERTNRKPVTLSRAYTDQLQLNRAWGYAGRKAWNALRATVKEYEAPKQGGDMNPGAVPFRELPAPEFVQVAFLRGLLQENEGDTKAALGDYSRAVMLSFGAEKAIARRALESALDLLVAHPDLETNRNLQAEGYALAQVYKTSFNQQEFPEAYRRFESPPPPDPEDAAAESDAAEGAAEEATGAEAADAGAG